MISLEFQGTRDGKSPQRSQHPVPAILGWLFHANPLESWSSFIIKPIRLLPATHSSCWRLSQSFPPLLAANPPAFKQNLLHGIHPRSLSEGAILTQLGEEAEDGGASFHSFCCTNLGEHSPGVGSPLHGWKMGLSFQFLHFLLYLQVTHCTFELSSVLLQPFPHKSLISFVGRANILIARFISGQLAARRQYLCQFVQNPRFPTGSSLTRGAQDHQAKPEHG